MEQTGCDLIFLDKKPPQSLVQQGLEGSTAVGKDEVGGSNPPSSSNKYLKSSDFRCFFVANVDFFVWVKMWGSGLTHTVTHTRNKLWKCQEMCSRETPKI